MRSLHPGRIDRIGHGLLAAVALGALLLVLWQNREIIAEISIRRLDLRWLGLALLISQVSLLLTFVRWAVLVRVIERRFAVRSALLLGFIGYVFNLIIPGAVGGDVVKAAYLSRMHIRRTQVIASMVVDRIVGLLGLLILAAMAGVLAWEMATPQVRIVIVAAWCALGAGTTMLTPAFRGAIARAFSRPGSRPCGRLATIMTELEAASTTYRGRPGVLLVSLVLSLSSHGLNVVVFFLVGKLLFSARLTTTLGQHFLMAPLTFFTTAVPLPFGALGLTEGVGGQLFSLVGHPGGAVAMMGFRLLMLICGLEGACVYLFNLGEIRALRVASGLNGTGTTARGSRTTTSASPSR